MRFFEQVGVRGAIAVTVREAEPRIYAPGELYTFDAALGAGSGSARLGARLPPHMVAGHWRHQRDRWPGSHTPAQVREAAHQYGRSNRLFRIPARSDWRTPSAVVPPPRERGQNTMPRLTRCIANEPICTASARRLKSTLTSTAIDSAMRATADRPGVSFLRSVLR